MAVVPDGVAAQTNPFPRMPSQGAFYTAGMQFSNGAVVLPFICAHLGLTWLAALLFPAYGLGSIVGNSVSPAVLRRVGQMRHLMLAAMAAGAAALILCDSVIAWNGVLAAAIFLLTSAGGGVLVAVSNVAYPDMASGKLSALKLLMVQGTIASVVATVAALLVVPGLATGDKATLHRDLLCLGAFGLAASGFAALFVGPVRSASTAPRTSVRDTYRQGIEVARTQPWFRRYVVTFLLFAPVTLGTTFYALRTAQQSGNLRVLVFLSTTGMVIGSALWHKVHQLFGVRGMMLGSALLSATAGALSIAAQSCGQWTHMWAYGTAFFLATVAALAVFAAAISWISVVAAEPHRGTLIAFCSTLLALETTALGGAFGGIAQNRSAIWPLAVVVVLAVAAAVAALGAPASQPRSAAVPA
ncbi:MFS transporter [Mycobacterium sp. E2989]|uniref:MFS transporter n=1 Tax=Mycobacterium sp. E2989 TaxID=1834140 RepID=UPI000AC79211|nr:MFS transporter [Mycobacterium sp. E2989]